MKELIETAHSPRAQATDAIGYLRPPSRPPWFRRAGGLICFGLPLLLTFDFQVVGRMFLSDISVLLLLPFAWREFRSSPRPPRIRWLLLTGIGWLVSLIVTDLIRQTPPEDFLRGWGEIALTLGALLIFYAAVHSDARRVLPLLWGVAVAETIRTWVVPIEAAAEVPWRLGGLSSLTLVILLTLLAAPRAIQSMLTIPSLLVLAGFALLQESRSTGGVLLAVALYLLWTGWLRLHGHSRPRGRHLAAAAVLALIGSLAILQTYSSLAESGALGESARTKYLQQQASSPAGLLITGRTANVGSVIAIVHSPVIGHGSRAVDPEYRTEAEYWLRRHGFTVELSGEDAIPAHSYFFGSWVQAGIGGPVFWVTALWVSLASLLAALPRASLALRGISAFLVLRIAWDIAFSPFGGLGRIYVPAYLVALMFIPLLAVSHYSTRPSVSPEHTSTAGSA